MLAKSLNNLDSQSNCRITGFAKQEEGGGEGGQNKCQRRELSWRVWQLESIKWPFPTF